MLIHRPNPVLDKLWSPEVLEKIKREAPLFDVRHRQLTQTKLLHDPVIGEYRQFAWANIPFPEIEMDVLAEGWPKESGVYHSHDFYEIVYVYSGHCHTLVSGKDTYLSSGDICIYNLHAVHRVEYENPGDVIFNLIIREDVFRKFLLEMLSCSDRADSFFLHILYDQVGSDTCVLLQPDSRYRCEELVQQLVETNRQDIPFKQNTLRAQLQLLLLEIARQHHDQCIAASLETPDTISIDAVVRYINQRHQTTTLEETARHFGYSARTLSRFIRKHTGCGFRDIMQDARFAHARAMLQETDDTIADIAAQLGYQDRSNFEIAFKKYCHITPAAYRKQFRK